MKKIAIMLLSAAIICSCGQKTAPKLVSPLPSGLEIDALTTGQKLYLETLEGYRREFSPLNTKVVVEDGLITAILRRWIP